MKNDYFLGKNSEIAGCQIDHDLHNKPRVLADFA
jgi:hypothetical protein